MNLSYLTLWSTIKVLAVVLALSGTSSAQDPTKEKEQEGPKKTAVRQLHPDFVESDPPNGISLLSGYKHKGATDFEGNQVGEISKSNGLKIKYEMGFSQGMATDPDQKETYVWYQEQKVNGRMTRYALSKSNVLMISVPLDDAAKTLHVANFYGTILRPSDIADMLLMVLPFASR